MIQYSILHATTEEHVINSSRYKTLQQHTVTLSKALTFFHVTRKGEQL